MMESVYHVGLHGNRILMVMGNNHWLVINRQAAIAITQPPEVIGQTCLLLR